MRLNSLDYTYPGKKSTVTDSEGKEKVVSNPEKKKLNPPHRCIYM
jgi:hypothetical protein